MKKALIFLGIAVGIGWVSYFGLSRAFAAENLRIGFKGIKARPLSFENGITLDITLSISNPTTAPLRLDSIDLVGTYKGNGIGSTVTGSNEFNTTIAPNATTDINVVYQIPISQVTSILGVGYDVILNVISAGLTFEFSKYFKGVILNFKGIAKSSNLSVPFDFNADLGTL